MSTERRRGAEMSAPPSASRSSAPGHDEFRPRYVGEIDLAKPPMEFVPPAKYRTALFLVRHNSVLLGVVEVDLDAEAVGSGLHAALASQLSISEARVGELRHQQAQAIEVGPAISVVVCTRNREDQLRQCLQALCRQQYPRFEIIVVDNTRGSSAVRDLVVEVTATVPIRLVVEPVTGIARARNRGASVSRGAVVAFIDDDALPDDHWVTEIAAGYVVVPEATAVNGCIVPGEIETAAQEFFFQYGGHSKGRGFEPQTIDPTAPGAQSALFPLPPFGAGANMSVRRDALLQIGGFDEALGAGTPATGAEETAAFTQLLLAGLTIVYRPTALVWHADRREFSDLAKQMRSLGTSLTAYYTSIVIRDPRLIPRLLRLLPKGIREVRGAPGSVRTESMSDSFPTGLMRSNRRGMVSGPLAYVRGSWTRRRLPSAIGKTT